MDIEKLRNREINQDYGINHIKTSSLITKEDVDKYTKIFLDANKHLRKYNLFINEKDLFECLEDIIQIEYDNQECIDKDYLIEDYVYYYLSHEPSLLNICLDILDDLSIDDGIYLEHYAMECLSID